MENKCVLSSVLKTLMDLADLMGNGKLFQRMGAAAAKARAPLVVLLKELHHAFFIFLYHIVYVPKRFFKRFEAKSSLINIQAMSFLSR